MAEIIGHEVPPALALAGLRKDSAERAPEIVGRPASSARSRRQIEAARTGDEQVDHVRL